MKTLFKLLLASLIFFTVMSCEDENNSSNCYKGKIISLEINDPDLSQDNGLIQIEESIPDGLLVNQVIIFDPSTISNNLKNGDILEFNIISLKEWQFTIGLFPEMEVFYAEIELCK
jgi:hypothetical protein